MKGKYFLTVADGEIHSTNSYELFVLYNVLFRGFDPHYAKDNARYPIRMKEPVDWNIITHNGKVIARKIDGEYIRVDRNEL